jgi:hypothetical protein
VVGEGPAISTSIAIQFIATGVITNGNLLLVVGRQLVSLRKQCNPFDPIGSFGPTMESNEVILITLGGKMIKLAIAAMFTAMTLGNEITAWLLVVLGLWGRAEGDIVAHLDEAPVGIASSDGW